MQLKFFSANIYLKSGAGAGRSQGFWLEPDLSYILNISRKKCQLHELSQEKSSIFYIIDGKEIILDTQTCF